MVMVDKGIFDLSGKVALVTGAGSGLGRAFAEAMAEYGADVVCNGRDIDKISETVQQIKKYGHRAIAIKADVSKQDEVQRMVDETVSTLGKIDILFNNAGITGPTKKIHETTLDEWDTILNTNLKGVLLVMKYVLPIMIQNKSGSIINIASLAGVRGTVYLAHPSYGASKAAVINLTQVAAMQYVNDGIRVNCIAPGMHKSSLARPKDPLLRQQREEFLERHSAANVPMGRMAAASEMKGLAILLASNASSYITGQVFIQDGGQSLKM